MVFTAVTLATANGVEMSTKASAVAPALPVLRLKRREERRLRAGHLWIYSNEVDTQQTPLRGLTPGQLVSIAGSTGRALGLAYANPNSLICARLLSRDTATVVDSAWIAQRLSRALALRERLFAAPYYRLVYGESDGLPGLVVDRYGDYLVLQFNTAGMEALRPEILAACQEVLSPRAIVLRNDAGVRRLEGLPAAVEVVGGALPDQVAVEEHGLRFTADLQGGQKTGWFYDQCDNRARLGRYVQGARVLDLFSYTGAWGVQAAARGAASVLCVDSSAPALAALQAHAAANGLAPQIATRLGDAFSVLRDLAAAGERFDVVVADPPAFIKRRKDHAQGSEAYQRLNQAAMAVLAADGVLISASCSYHLARAELQQLMLRAARRAGRELAILEHGYQSADHPIHPAMPETEYLKAIVARVSAP